MALLLGASAASKCLDGGRHRRPKACKTAPALFVVTSGWLQY